MSFDSNVRDIKRLVEILTGKDTDVVLTYKGTSFGITKSYHIRCDTRETSCETYEEAASSLLSTLKQELQDKINFAERQTEDYKKVLSQIGKPTLAKKSKSYEIS